MAVQRRSVDTRDLDVAVEVFAAAFTGGGLQVSDLDDEFRLLPASRRHP
jgi:hypothetical protein